MILKLFLATLIFGAVSQKAFCVLGEQESSLGKVKVASGAKQHRALQISPLFRVNEVSNDGTRIREFVDASGLVFAVTWRGLAQPDLSVLLGQHFAEFDQLSRQNKTLRLSKPKPLFGDAIFVERGGHFGDIRGRAILKAALPKGVKPGDLPW